MEGVNVDNQSIAFNSDVSTDKGGDREDIIDYLLEADEVLDFISQKQVSYDDFDEISIVQSQPPPQQI